MRLHCSSLQTVFLEVDISELHAFGSGGALRGLAGTSEVSNEGPGLSSSSCIEQLCFVAGRVSAAERCVSSVRRRSGPLLLQWEHPPRRISCFSLSCKGCDLPASSPPLGWGPKANDWPLGETWDNSFQQSTYSVVFSEQPRASETKTSATQVPAHP